MSVTDWNTKIVMNLLFPLICFEIIIKVILEMRPQDIHIQHRTTPKDTENTAPSSLSLKHE